MSPPIARVQSLENFKSSFFLDRLALKEAKFVSILVKNGMIVTSDSRNRIIENGAVVIEGDKIVDVGLSKQLEEAYSSDTVIDAEGKIVIPGLVCCHCHMYNTLTVDGLAGVEGTGVSPFVLGLEDFWWPYVEDQLSKKEICVAALLSSVQMVKTGTTCITDCLEAPFSLPGVLDKEAEVVRKVGIRGILSIETSERVSEENAELAANENLDFVRKWNRKDDLIRGKFCTHTTFSCSEKLLKRVRKEADDYGCGIQIHLEESQDEAMFSLVKHRKTPVEFYDEIGFLSSDLLAAQCVFPTDAEIGILRKHDVKIAHIPVNEFGICPVVKMRNAGLTVGLGTDGITNMFEAMHIAAVIHNAHLQNPILVSPEDVFRMATIGGARTIGCDEMIGSLEPNKKADVVILNPKPSVPLTTQNAIEQLVLFGCRLKIDSVVVNGKFVMESGKLLTVNEEEVYRLSKEVALSFWEKLKEKRENLPHPQPYRCS